MSTLYVDNLQPNLGSQVEIADLKPPIGNVINAQRVVCNSALTLSANQTWTDIPLGTFSYTPKQPDSLLQIEVVAHVYGYLVTNTWTGAAVRCLVDGTSVSSTPSNIHYGSSPYNDYGMGYAIDLSEYTCTSASAVSIKAQAYTHVGATNSFINQFGLGYVRVLEIAQ
jgi:hypothetical protein